MKLYQVTLADGQTFLMRADLEQASAHISACFDPEDEEPTWQATPYQTADAGHRGLAAAQLCAMYFAFGSGDCWEVATVKPVQP